MLLRRHAQISNKINAIQYVKNVNLNPSQKLKTEQYPVKESGPCILTDIIIEYFSQIDLTNVTSYSCREKLNVKSGSLSSEY